MSNEITVWEVWTKDIKSERSDWVCYHKYIFTSQWRAKFCAWRLRIRGPLSWGRPPIGVKIKKNWRFI